MSSKYKNKSDCRLSMLAIKLTKLLAVEHYPSIFRIHATPHEWNQLPLYIKKISGIDIFKSRLKIYLFGFAFSTS